jgi:hypothetical protein
MSQIKARLLIPATKSVPSLEGIAEGSILIIDGKQFAVGWLNNINGTYNFSVLRKEVLNDGEVILKVHYQLTEKNRKKGILVQTSTLDRLYPPNKDFEKASDRLRLLQLINKQHPY